MSQPLALARSGHVRRALGASVQLVDPVAYENPVYLSLVVPVYGGNGRLPRSLDRLQEFRCRLGYGSELIVIDDGSTTPVAEVVARHAGGERDVTVLRNEHNRGKGFSVARGMAAARGAYRVFTDADLAYPTSEIDKIVGTLEDGADIAVACRVLPESRYVMSPTFFPYLFTRHLMSRAYNAVVRGTLVPGVLDTQAGLKGFTAAAADVVFPRVSVPRFGFDVESLVIARRHGLRIEQTAVEFHYDDEPTTVRFLRDAGRMGRDLARVWWNARRDRYA